MNRQDRGGAWQFLSDFLRCRHASQDTSPPALAMALLKQCLCAIGEPITHHLKAPATTVFHRDHEVGATLKAGLVNKDTLNGTTTELLRWLTLSTMERKQMALNALELFRSRFDFASVSKNLLPILF